MAGPAHVVPDLAALIDVCLDVAEPNGRHSFSGPRPIRCRRRRFVGLAVLEVDLNRPIEANLNVLDPTDALSGAHGAGKLAFLEARRAAFRHGWKASQMQRNEANVGVGRLSCKFVDATVDIGMSRRPAAKNLDNPEVFQGH